MSKNKKPKVDFKNVSKHFNTSDFEAQVVPTITIKSGKAINDTLRDYSDKAPQQKSKSGNSKSKDYKPLDKNEFRDKIEKINKQKANVEIV